MCIAMFIVKSQKSQAYTRSKCKIYMKMTTKYFVNFINKIEIFEYCFRFTQNFLS